MPDEPTLTKLQTDIRDLLQRHPEGLSIDEIRTELGIEGQQHLDRRVRDLDRHYEIARTRRGRKVYYTIGGRKVVGPAPASHVTLKTRAKILNRDGSRCQMCGRTVKDDGVRLQVDHKIPQAWGGSNDESNLWTLCNECNQGKRDHFASLDAAVMKDVLQQSSVHKRIAHLLKAADGEWVHDDDVEFVANFQDHQTDWRKRLRELRYLGLTIRVRRRKIGFRTHSSYRLENWVELPEDPSSEIRRYEQLRAKSKLVE